MQNKYTKILLTLLVIAFIVPQITLAVWWNPFSWGFWNSLFHRQKVLTTITNCVAEGEKYGAPSSAADLCCSGLVMEPSSESSSGTQGTCIKPTVNPTAGWKIYTNAEYGFEIKYPEKAVLETSACSAEVNCRWYKIKVPTISNTEAEIMISFPQGEMCGSYGPGVASERVGEEIIFNNKKYNFNGWIEDAENYIKWADENPQYGSAKPQKTDKNYKRYYQKTMTVCDNTFQFNYSISFENLLKQNDLIEVDNLIKQIVSTFKFTAPVDPTAGWKTYNDKNGRYSIKYPSNWTYDNFSCNTDGVAFCAAKNGVSGCGQTCALDSIGYPIYLYVYQGSPAISEGANRKYWKDTNVSILLGDNTQREIYNNMISTFKAIK